MTDSPDKARCAEFQAQLADLIGSGQDASNDPHLQNCELCRALLADLQTIAEAARQLFPGVEPPDTVWEHIESAIKSDDDDSLKPGAAPPSQ
jgi:hypothetical protein